MPRQITIYTGSFKPPHRGHLSLVKKMLQKTKTPRTGDKGPGYVYVFISSKVRDPCSKLTGQESKKIWQIYLQTLPKESQDRVKLIVSHMKSPILTAYGFAKKVAAPGDYFYLVKSSKNAQNTRYSSFRSLATNHRIRFQEVILPGFADLHSTDMRELVKKKKRKEFDKFLPKKLTNTQKDNVWKLLKDLC